MHRRHVFFNLVLPHATKHPRSPAPLPIQHRRARPGAIANARRLVLRPNVPNAPIPTAAAAIATAIVSWHKRACCMVCRHFTASMSHGASRVHDQNFGLVGCIGYFFNIQYPPCQNCTTRCACIRRVHSCLLLRIFHDHSRRRHASKSAVSGSHPAYIDYEILYRNKKKKKKSKQKHLTVKYQPCLLPHLVYFL